MSVDVDQPLALVYERLLAAEGADGGDALQRLAEEGIDGGFGDRLEPLDLPRRLKVEALEEEEEEEEDRDDDEDERRDDGDGDAGSDDEENHHQNVFYQIRDHIVRHLDVLREPENELKAK